MEHRWIPASISRLCRRRNLRGYRGYSLSNQSLSEDASSAIGEYGFPEVPRLNIPEAILEGHCEGYFNNTKL
jgi:hypothetical protein